MVPYHFVVVHLVIIYGGALRVIVIVIVNTTICIAPSVASYFYDALQDC